MDQIRTFGVTLEIIKTYLPQLQLGGTFDLFTSARIDVAISHAASRVCGVYLAAGVDLEELEADTTSIAYLQAQRLLCLIVVPQIIGGQSGLGIGVEDVVRDCRDEARDIINRLQSKPAEFAAGDTLSPQVISTVPSSPTTLPARRWQNATGARVRR